MDGQIVFQNKILCVIKPVKGHQNIANRKLAVFPPAI